MQFNSDFIDYLRKHKRLVTPTTQACFDEIDKVNKLTDEKSELLEFIKKNGLEEKFQQEKKSKALVANKGKGKGKGEGEDEDEGKSEGRPDCKFP